MQAAVEATDEQLIALQYRMQISAHSIFFIGPEMISLWGQVWTVWWVR